MEVRGTPQVSKHPLSNFGLDKLLRLVTREMDVQAFNQGPCKASVAISDIQQPVRPSSFLP